MNDLISLEKIAQGQKLKALMLDSVNSLTKWCTTGPWTNFDEQPASLA